jgi:hypothetical protein
VSEVAVLVVSAVVGAIAGVVTTAWKSRKDLEAQYDIDLRKRRIDAYAELWKLLEPLADYFEPGQLTHDSARKLGAALRRWYFRTGGLVLSSGSRPAYFNLQQALEGAAPSPADDSRKLEKRQLDILKALASRLRTSSTDDVATRLRPRLGPSLVATLIRPWRRRFAPLRVTVDRRWRWEAGVPELAFFVIVANASDRELEIVGVEVPGTGKAASEVGESGFRLQPGEDRELSVEGSPPVGGPIAPEVTVRVEGRDALRLQATPAVPLQSHLIRREQSAQASGGDGRPDPGR